MFEDGALIGAIMSKSRQPLNSSRNLLGSSNTFHFSISGFSRGTTTVDAMYGSSYDLSKKRIKIVQKKEKKQVFPFSLTKEDISRLQIST